MRLPGTRHVRLSGRQAAYPPGPPRDGSHIFNIGREKFKMNKKELIAIIAEKAKLTKKDTEKVLDAMEEVIAETLKNHGKVQMVGFGTFEVAERDTRDGRNPRTGEKITIKPTKIPRFKPGQGLKAAVNG